MPLWLQAGQIEMQAVVKEICWLHAATVVRGILGYRRSSRFRLGTTHTPYVYLATDLALPRSQPSVSSAQLPWQWPSTANHLIGLFEMSWWPRGSSPPASVARS
ncbi:hypothetical protein CLAIMM_14721 isoform 1, partial [Cladophialophora immunda]